jgi:hypothetical protein
MTYTALMGSANQQPESGMKNIKFYQAAVAQAAA